MKNKTLPLALLIVALAACAPSGGVNTDVCNLSGAIDSEVTLDPATCSPYNVVDDLTISDAGRLIIEPGTTLAFAQDTGLTVSGHGALVAVGTASDEILFTGASKIRGYWSGITFASANSFDNELKYVEIEYAGADERWDNGAYGDYRAAVDVQTGSRLKMTYSLVRESLGSGLFIDTGTYFGADDLANGDFAHNTITANASYPVIMYCKQVGFLDASNDFDGNDGDYNFVRFAGGYEYVDTQTWQQLNVPYLVKTQTSVDDGEKLTIAPGTQLVFEQDAGLEAYGSAAAIYAVGTPTEPITFTAKQPVNGYWAGLHFNDSDSSDNVLRYVVVEYGGSNNTFLDADDRGNIVVSSSGNASHQRIVIEDSTIRHSAAWGISIAAETSATINGNTYDDNDSGNFRQR